MGLCFFQGVDVCVEVCVAPHQNTVGVQLIRRKHLEHHSVDALDGVEARHHGRTTGSVMQFFRW